MVSYLGCFALSILVLCLQRTSVSASFCPKDCNCRDSEAESGATVLRVVCPKIVEITNHFIRGLSKRQKIDLVINLVKNLEPNVFRGFQNITYLSITARKLEFMHKDVFSQMIHLQDLLIILTQLSTLDVNIFGNLQSLATLSIKDNRRLKFNENSVFPPLPKLQVLELLENFQIEVNENIFTRLTNIKAMRLGRLTMKEIKEDFLSQLKNLEELDLKNNKITKIHANSFKNLQNLKIIDLSNNLLRSMDAVLLFNSTKVHTLLLSENLLTSFPKRLISNMKDLKILDLSNNKIESIDQGLLLNAKSLTDVSFSNNQVKMIHPDLFVKSREIKFIDLSWNIINFIPKETFQNLELLHILRLHHNNISSLHFETLKGLSRLKYLDLNHNRLSFTDESSQNENKDFDYNSKENTTEERNNIFVNNNSEPTIVGEEKNHSTFDEISMATKGALTNETRALSMFDHVPRVKALRLQSNMISVLPKYIFHGLKELQILDLSKNSVESLENVLISCSKLVSLFMMDNKVTSLSGNLFSGLNKLSTINFQNNRISFLHHNFLSSNFQLFYVDFRGNNLFCSCYLSRLLRDKTTNFNTDCLIKEKRIDINQINCDDLTEKWQSLRLPSPAKNSNKMMTDDWTITNPGKEFKISFHIRHTNACPNLYMNVTSRFTQLSTSQKQNESISVPVCLSNAWLKFLRDVNDPRSNDFILVQMIYEKELFNSRFTVFVNEIVVESFVSSLDKKYDDIMISADKIHEEYRLYDLSAYSSRCALINQSCVSTDGYDNSTCTCIQKSNGLLIFPNILMCLNALLTKFLISGWV